MLNIAYNLYQYGKQYLQRSEIETDPIKNLPSEIFFQVFFQMPNRDIGSSACVNRQWNHIIYTDNFLEFICEKCQESDLTALVKKGFLTFQDLARYLLTNNSKILHAHYPDIIKQDFQLLVETQYLSWREVARFAQLSFFLKGIIEDINSNNGFSGNGFVRNENPNFSGSYIEKFKQPCYVSALYRFTISNLSNVKCHQKGGEAPELLIGQDGKTISCLAGEKNNLLVLREDGVIVIWDIKTKKIMSTFETSCSRVNLDENKVYISSFHVQNDMAILKYRIFENTSKIHDNIEIINYLDPKKTNIIEIPIFERSFCFPEKTLIYNNKVYILQRDSIFVWNLITQSQEEIIQINMDNQGKDPCHYYLYDMTLENNILYVSDSARWFHMIEITTGQEIRKISVYYSELRNLCIVEGKLFTFNSDISIGNTYNGRVELSIPPQNIFEGAEINRRILIALIEQIVEKKLKPKKETVNDFWKLLLSLNYLV